MNFMENECGKGRNRDTFPNCCDSVTNTSFAHQDSQTCQSIQDIKKMRKQLAFYKTSNTSKRTTSCSNPPGHSSPHSSTGDGGAQDDNAKKSNSSTSSSLGGIHNSDTPERCDPTSPAPDPTPTSRSPSPDGCPHSPLPDNGEDSSPASKDTGKDLEERMFTACRATASCSCCSIQSLGARGHLPSGYIVSSL